LQKWNREKVNCVTRLRSNTVVQIKKNRRISKKEREKGVEMDQIVLIGGKKDTTLRVKCRLVTYYDKKNRIRFQFLTNNLRILASTVATIYKQRWQVETLFKRLKQNLQYQYFLGDNENAIRIHIWCMLIADLLLKVSTNKVKKKWAFSNLASLVRLHLMNYTDLRKFLNDPDKTRIFAPMITQETQLKLFSSA
jgi:IS4 transposase